MFIRNSYLYSTELDCKEMLVFYLTLLSTCEGMCHYLETCNSNVGGVHIHKRAMGVWTDIAFLDSTKLSKLSWIVTLHCGWASASHPSWLQEWTELDGNLGCEHGEGLAQTQHFGTQNWKGIMDGPSGVCNGHDQLFKHTLVIFKLPKAICRHLSPSCPVTKQIVSSHCINRQSLNGVLLQTFV